MARSLRASRFNFAVFGEQGEVALYNAATGALVSLSGPHGRTLAEALLEPATHLSEDDLDTGTLGRLRRGQFLVPPGTDEVAPIREKFWAARGASPPILTVTTTMDCNLGCYYCYEDRSGNALKTGQIPDLVALAERMMAESPLGSFHVDWYGGEPLLNLDFMETASRALIETADRQGARYSASVISNGTEWPDDVEDFILRHRISEVQISFDGLKDNHDKRRHYRKPFRRAGASSFEKAVSLVDRLVAVVRVDVRYNLDRGNAADLDGFLDFASERGWFDAHVGAVFQPARLASYSERSAFMRERQLSLEEFDALRAHVRERLKGLALVEESEIPDGYPFPRRSVCAALASQSHVLGAEGALYRCGLQVGESNRATGRLGTATRGDDATWWEAFDPTKAPTCSGCSFLPVCWGGCPKKHLELDQSALDEQGEYWRTNLPRLIAERAGFARPIPSEIPRELQFRSLA